MKLDTNLNRWADTHVFYNLYLHQHNGRKSKLNTAEHKWRELLLNETPNGKLIVNNSFFDALGKDKKIYLLHITTNLDGIVKSGNLYPSGGCLVGSIYCTPIFENNGELRLHNLGAYILYQEAPRSLGSRKGNNNLVDSLIIEVSLPERARNNYIGIDYLRLGNMHLQIFRELEYLLSQKEQFTLYEKIIVRIKNALEFLSFSNKAFCSKQLSGIQTFFKLLCGAIENLPILGYFYFEVVTEYLLLHQNDPESEKHLGMGEFYNWHYKNLMFSLYPQLLKGFRLSEFKPTVETLSDYLEKNQVFKKFDRKHFADYIFGRLVYLINSRLVSENTNLVDWCRLKWKFDDVADSLGPLVGHLIHRELRTFGRHPDFYFYYDQYKALQIWNYWNHMGVAIPFNGVIPKGEVGINPAYASLRYKIYKSKARIGKDNCTYIEPGKQLDVSMVPRLVDLKYTFMRN